jgi:hypothetical protein
MNIDSDIYRLAKSLVELAPDKAQDKNQVTIDSFYYKDRHPHNPFYYKFEQTVSELARLKYIKVVKPEKDFYWSVRAMCQYIYPKYIIEYSIKNLKEYLRNRRGHKYEIFENKIEEQVDIKNFPFLVREKDKGYLKFSERSEKILIGKVETRPFLFLNYMLNPNYFGNLIDVNTVMENIMLKKDETNQKLNKYYGNLADKIKIIKNSCIKQLQKGNKLRSKVVFEFNDKKTHIKGKFVK